MADELLDPVATTGGMTPRMSWDSVVAMAHPRPDTPLWEYLREQAHRCVQLARSCPDLTTSHALEAMGLEFLEKAAELERMNSIPPAEATDKS